MILGLTIDRTDQYLDSRREQRLCPSYMCIRRKDVGESANEASGWVVISANHIAVKPEPNLQLYGSSKPAYVWYIIRWQE